MPMSWNDEEYSATPTVTEANATRVIESLESSPQAAEVDLDEQLAEVDQRVELIQYYRSLLIHDFFDGDNTASAVSVQSEVRQFIRGRLKVLLGMEVEREVVKEQPLFNAEELAALKALAAKVMGKPALIEKPASPTPHAPKQPPTLKKAAPPPTPAATPVTTKKAQPKAAPKAAKTVQATKPQQPKPQGGKGGGKVINENGKVYKIVLVDGKEVKMDITPQARPVGAVPFPTPTGPQATSISENQAKIEASSYADPLVNVVVQKAME